MITTQNLTKTFGGRAAVSGLGLNFESGRIYGLVGTNGAGKSTLLRMLCGIYRPNAGSAALDGEPIFEHPASKERIVLVPDDLYFLPGATLEEMARFYRESYPRWNGEKFERLLGAFPLERCAKLSGFSKGMRRQAALILALAREPDYLLLDEAFDGLDPVIRLGARKLIADEVAARQMTAVISSHNLRELEDLCDHVTILHEGRLLMTREMDDLRSGYCKVQTAFRTPREAVELPGLEILRSERLGSVWTLLVRGGEEEVRAALDPLDPLLLDCIPLSLEEVFISEMEAIGYDYDHILF